MNSYHEWPFAGGTDTFIGVVKTGSSLTFLDMTTDSPTLNVLNSGASISITEIADAKISTSVINNSLIMVSSVLANPLLFEYDSSTDTVSYSELEIKVRDFWGIDDGLSLTARPNSLSASHNYNLKNQGWINTIVTDTGALVLDRVYSYKGRYPSNSDIWYLGKNTNSIFDPRIMITNNQGWMQAARGKYIIDLYNRGASRITESGVSGLPQDTETGRITAVTSFAGRIFYSGIQSKVNGGDKNSPNYSGYIFFSQSITNKERLTKCYQEADPTDENISDLVDTDGGVISIPDAYKINKLVATGSSLVIFAENGVWEIFAGDTGFKATEYQLAKISNIGVTNPDSVVLANNSVFFWANSGIYLLSRDKVSGRLQANSISLGTIQSFYLDIPETGRQSAKGFFEEVQGRIRWLYAEEEKYNRELIFDASLEAFYPFSIATSPYWVTDYVPVPNFAYSSTTDTVYSGSEIVVDDLGEEVEVTINSQFARESFFFFLTEDGTGFTLSKYNSRTFLDWGTENYSSYMVTGYELFQDMVRKKQVPQVIFLFKRTEGGYDSNLDYSNPSSCLVQAQWNWADSANSGKWGTQFQAYRLNRNYIPSGVGDSFDYGEFVVVTKNRLRGYGRTLSLKIQSEEGKDMHLLGWAVRAFGNALP